MPARILVIEDNPTNMDLMTFLLESFGHTVLHRSDGEDVLEFVRAQRPDIIACDIQLRTVDGYEVARQLRAAPGLSSIPLIAVTAFAMVGDRAKLLAAGFDGYLSKPIEPATFVQQLQVFLPADQRLVGPEPQVSSSIRHSVDSRAVRGSILVLDDPAADLSLIRTLLELAGYKLRIADCWDDALAMARQSAPDVFLADIRRLKRNAGDLVPSVDGDPLIRDIPCILVSSTASEMAVQNSTRAGGENSFIVKPIDPQQLLAEIGRLACTEGSS